MPQNCPGCGKENSDEMTLCHYCGAALRTSDPETGTILENRYEILGIIKSGAMGCVYKARDRRLETAVAVKKMFSAFVTKEEGEYAERRFIEEAKLLSSLHHGGLPKVIDYFTAKDPSSEKMAHYLVMTFIEGKDLESIIAERDLRLSMNLSRQKMSLHILRISLQ